MLDWATLVRKYNLRGEVNGVLAVGAHLAEEAPAYAELNVPVWWVEANPGVFDKIRKALKPYPRQKLIEALITDVDGEERKFNVTNYDGMSSSVLEFGTHPTFSPDTVWVDHLTLPTRTLDSLVDEHEIKANMLVMDLQGAEGLALKGAAKLIESLDYVYSEFNIAEVYIGCVKLDEMDRILHDFERVETTPAPNGWGDCLFVRRGR